MSVFIILFLVVTVEAVENKAKEYYNVDVLAD